MWYLFTYHIYKYGNQIYEYSDLLKHTYHPFIRTDTEMHVGHIFMLNAYRNFAINTITTKLQWCTNETYQVLISFSQVYK